MNKLQFITKLRYELLSLPEREREDILQEYDAHFEFGKQQGRTEEEIAKELGVPEELAQELVGDGGGDRPEPRYDRSRHEQPRYEHPRYEEPRYQSFSQGQDMRGPAPSYMPPPNQHQDGFPPPYPPQGQPYYDNQPPRRRGSSVGQLFTIIMIGFASLIIVPLLISGWAVCISLAAVAGVLLLLPVIYVFKLAIGGPFHGGELSMVAIAFGLGLLFAQLIGVLFKGYGLVNIGYGKWVSKLVRGGA